MANIHDVAKKANVSISTVSYAFNKPHLVKPATQARIFQAAQELNYQPNHFARGLAGAKTQTVGILVPDLRYPFTSTIARGAEDLFRAAEYLPFILSTDGQSSEIIRLMEHLVQTRGVDGFLLVPSYFGVDTTLREAIKSLNQAGVPVILAGFQVDDPAIEFTTYLPLAGSREVVAHLTQLGHRAIAYIGFDYGQQQATARIDGYRAALNEAHIAIRDEYIKATDMTPWQVRAAMQELLALPEPPTAVFALNDVAAMAVIDVCRERNVAVPNDLSLVSFDYQALAQRITPQITSIVVPTYDVGQTSARLLLNRQATPDIPIQQVALPYHLAIRETTAVPNRLPDGHSSLDHAG